jgi:hypothetical protein
MSISNFVTWLFSGDYSPLEFCTQVLPTFLGALITILASAYGIWARTLRPIVYRNTLARSEELRRNSDNLKMLVGGGRYALDRAEQPVIVKLTTPLARWLSANLFEDLDPVRRRRLVDLRPRMIEWFDKVRAALAEGLAATASHPQARQYRTIVETLNVVTGNKKIKPAVVLTALLPKLKPVLTDAVAQCKEARADAPLRKLCAVVVDIVGDQRNPRSVLKTWPKTVGASCVEAVDTRKNRADYVVVKLACDSLDVASNPCDPLAALRALQQAVLADFGKLVETEQTDPCSGYFQLANSIFTLVRLGESLDPIEVLSAWVNFAHTLLDEAVGADNGAVSGSNLRGGVNKRDVVLVAVPSGNGEK